MITGGVACLVAGLGATSAGACRLALVLALDVSSSVDASEDALQRGGVASALVAPDVRRAFFASDSPVALAVFEWSGRYNQAILQDWVLVDTPDRLAAISDRIAATPRSHSDYPTAMGHAVGFAASLLQRAPVCDAQTVDVSGDGPNNDGFGTDSAYAAFPFDGVIVNGLVIRTVQDTFNNDRLEDLAGYYRSNVLRGPGAFLIEADGFEDFARAMEAKLVRELSPRVIGQAEIRGQGE